MTEENQDREMQDGHSDNDKHAGHSDGSFTPKMTAPQQQQQEHFAPFQNTDDAHNMDNLLSKADDDRRQRRDTANFGDRAQQEVVAKILNDFEEVKSKSYCTDDSESSEDQDKVDLENTDEEEEVESPQDFPDNPYTTEIEKKRRKSTKMSRLKKQMIALVSPRNAEPQALRKKSFGSGQREQLEKSGKMFGGFVSQTDGGVKQEKDGVEMTQTSPSSGTVAKKLMFQNASSKQSMFAKGMQDELDDVKFEIPDGFPGQARHNTISTSSSKQPGEDFKINESDDGSFVKISPMIKKTKYIDDPTQKRQRNQGDSSVLSNNSGTRSKRKTTTLKAKSLTPDFADKVLTIELKIDQGNFNMTDIESLMNLYSQAVEFYDGMNDERYVTYESRIQNLLIKPAIATVMANASRDPEGYKKQEAEKKALIENQTAEEAAKAKQAELDRQKKERAQQMKKNSQKEEKKKMQATPHYKEAVDMMNQTVNNQTVAKLEVARDLDNQKSNMKQRIAQRKRQMQQRKDNGSNASFDAGFNSFLSKSPMSTRNNTIRSKPIKQGLLEYNAYLPSTPGDFGGMDKSPKILHKQQSITPRPTSFTPLFEADDLNDISGIANDLDETANGGLGSSFFDSQVRNAPNKMIDTFEEDMVADMSRDVIDDEAYHSEIKTIWAATEQKVEDVQQEQEADMEAAIEEITSLKFEKLAEVKANYDMMLKMLKPIDDKQKAKIESLKAKKEESLEKVRKDMAAMKKQRVDDIKKEAEAKKKALHVQKDEALEQLQHRENDRRKTKVTKNRERITSIRQGPSYYNQETSLRSHGSSYAQRMTGVSVDAFPVSPVAPANQASMQDNRPSPMSSPVDLTTKNLVGNTTKESSNEEVEPAFFMNMDAGAPKTNQDNNNGQDINRQGDEVIANGGVGNGQ